jgi:hypothetical protein
LISPAVIYTAINNNKIAQRGALGLTRLLAPQQTRTHRLAGRLAGDEELGEDVAVEAARGALAGAALHTAALHAVSMDELALAFRNGGAAVRHIISVLCFIGHVTCLLLCCVLLCCVYVCVLCRNNDVCVDF